jgi:hypothetical protein
MRPVPDSLSDLRKRYSKESTALVLHLLKNARDLPWDTRWIDPLVTELESGRLNFKVLAAKTSTFT